MFLMLDFSLLNHSHCTPSQAAAQNGHLECAQYIENASRLQSQEQVKTMQQCVTMQPSHLVQGQMEQQVAEIPFQNGHFVDGPSPVDTEMDMAGDCPMIGMKRGRDDCCDEESFKRMRKGGMYYCVEMLMGIVYRYLHLLLCNIAFSITKSKYNRHTITHINIECFLVIL